MHVMGYKVRTCQVMDDAMPEDVCDVAEESFVVLVCEYGHGM